MSKLRHLDGFLVQVAFMRIFQYMGCLSVLAFGMLTGCSSAVIQTPTLSTNPDLDYATYYKPEDYKDPQRAKFYLHPLPTDISRVAAEAKASGIRVQTVLFRDYVQNELLKRSDQICTIYITRLEHNFVQGSAGLKIGEALVKAFLVPVAIADATFSATSGEFNSSLSNEILQHESFKSVVARIIDRRATARIDIFKNQEKSLASYSVSRAIYDAENYHSLCNYAVQYVAGESSSQPPAPSPKSDSPTPKAPIKPTPGGK